jgi:hypothetical protein
MAATKLQIPVIDPGAAEFRRRRRITLDAAAATAAVNLSARRRILLTAPPHFFRLRRHDSALPYETHVRSNHLYNFHLHPRTFPVTLTSQKSAKT